MTTTIMLVDWDWADSNPDDPCVRDAHGRSIEASVKVGAATVAEPPRDDAALWAIVNGAEWDRVDYRSEDGVREMVAATAEEKDGCLLVVIRDERIMGGFLR
jgi:hypothetical protein